MSGTAELVGAVADLLGDVVVTSDLGEAAAFVRDNPGLRVVTVEGDLLGAHWARGGSAGGQSLLDVRAAADEAEANLATAEVASEAAADALAAATEAAEAARQELEETRGRMRAVDASAAEISGRLGRLAGAARAAADEASASTRRLPPPSATRRRTRSSTPSCRASWPRRKPSRTAPPTRNSKTSRPPANVTS